MHYVRGIKCSNLFHIAILLDHNTWTLALKMLRSDCNCIILASKDYPQFVTIIFRHAYIHLMSNQHLILSLHINLWGDKWLIILWPMLFKLTLSWPLNFGSVFLECSVLIILFYKYFFPSLLVSFLSPSWYRL